MSVSGWRAFVVAVLGSSVIPPSLLSQADTSRIWISGVVLDPLRHPIEGAEIRIVAGNASTLSGPDGAFRFSTSRSSEVLLQVRRPGFQSQLLTLHESWKGTVLLEPGTYQLPDVQVTARYAKPVRYAGTTKYDDYFRRRRQGLGEFIDREEIDRRNPIHTTDILEGRPGIKVMQSVMTSTTLVAFARCNEYPPRINVYVDGHKLIPINGVVAGRTQSAFARSAKDPEIAGMVGEMLSRVNPAEVELMEIFRGPGELPPDFNDGNCGAVVIWTREGGR